MSSAGWDILGVGDTDVDLFLRVDRLPAADEKVIAELVGERPGGMVANYCCAASRLGARTGVVSVVGNDAYGRAALADLAKCGVDVTHVSVREDGRTYFCVVHLDPSGEKALSVVLTDCRSPSWADVRQVEVGKARLVHLAATDLELGLSVAKKARRHGALVSLDIEPGAVAREPKLVRKILRSVDIASANASALRNLIGSGSDADPAKLLQFGPRVGIVMLGAGGSVATDGHDTVRCAAFAVPTVDSTGAGDCFNAGFDVAFLRGWRLARSLEFASAVAAISVGAVGGHAGAPSMADVSKFLSQRRRAIATEVV